MNNTRLVLKLMDEIKTLENYLDDRMDTISHAEIIRIHDAIMAIWPNTSRRAE